MVKEVTDKDEFEQMVKESVVMAYFTAKWCSPCHMIAPHFEELAVSGNYPTTAFVKVDVDDAELIADKAGVNAMPTFQVWRDGSKLEEFSGADKPKLKELCDKYCC
mmetsp:Transcript_17008/g.34772  ORF Transcript_17008/g.34772 Transcript_17008/m.34772 type:complete len:106 (-) Transcript_17008:414-731(-)